MVSELLRSTMDAGDLGYHLYQHHQFTPPPRQPLSQYGPWYSNHYHHPLHSHVPIPSAINDGNRSYQYQTHQYHYITPYQPYQPQHLNPNTAEQPHLLHPYGYTISPHHYQSPPLNQQNYTIESLPSCQDTMEDICSRLEVHFKTYNAQLQAISDRWKPPVCENHNSEAPQGIEPKLQYSERGSQNHSRKNRSTIDAGNHLHGHTASSDQITICMQRLQASILREQEICARFRARIRLRRSKRPLRIGGCRRSRRLRSWRFSTLITSFTVISNLRSQMPLSTDDDLVNNGKQVVLEQEEIHSVEENDEVCSDDGETFGDCDNLDNSDLGEAFNDCSRQPWKPPWNRYASSLCPSHHAQKLFDQLPFITANQNSKTLDSLPETSVLPLNPAEATITKTPALVVTPDGKEQQWSKFQFQAVPPRFHHLHSSKTTSLGVGNSTQGSHLRLYSCSETFPIRREEHTIKVSFQSIVASFSVNSFSKCRWTVKAHKVFDEITQPKPNLQALAEAYVKNNDVFQKHQHKNVHPSGLLQPNLVTVSCCFAQHVLEFEPAHYGNYALLSNVNGARHVHLDMQRVDAWCLGLFGN